MRRKARGVARSPPDVNGSWDCVFGWPPAKLGVSRTAGANWLQGHKTNRNAVAVGFVAPLDRLDVREVSPRCLSQDERVEMTDLRQSA